MSGSNLDKIRMRTETEARLSRAVPTASDLRHIREELGLSQPELSDALGFSASKGPQTIRDWEKGVRAEQPFHPTNTVWAAIRYLVIAVHLFREMPAGTLRDNTSELLPERVR